MSIATDEALEWHGLHGDEPGDRDSTYSAEELDAAYIAGRTAEPTEEEIDAAIAAYLIHNMSFTHCDPPQPCTCGLEFPSKKSRAEHVFGEILKAARKVVTE